MKGTASTLFILMASGALAHPHQYKVIDLGSLGFSSALPRAINDKGQITGAVSYSRDINGSDSFESFIWDPSTGLRGIQGYGSESQSEGYSINDRGEIVGQTTTDNGTHMCKWDSAGKLLLLDDRGAFYSQATGINNGGTIVGGTESIQSPDGAFIMPSGQAPKFLAASSSFSIAINNHDQCVGWSLVNNLASASFWDPNSGQVDLGTASYLYSQASALNDSGAVIGTAWDAHGRSHAILWMNGTSTELGTTDSVASDINNHGQIVGTDIDATLWDNGKTYDLNNCIVPGSGFKGVLLNAYAINNGGWITGRSLVDGEQHGFVLVPQAVPEPTSMAMIGLGLVAMLRRKRK